MPRGAGVPRPSSGATPAWVGALPPRRQAGKWVRGGPSCRISRGRRRRAGKFPQRGMGMPGHRPGSMGQDRWARFEQARLRGAGRHALIHLFNRHRRLPCPRAGYPPTPLGRGLSSGAPPGGPRSLLAGLRPGAARSRRGRVAGQVTSSRTATAAGPPAMPARRPAPARRQPPAAPAKTDPEPFGGAGVRPRKSRKMRASCPPSRSL